MALNASKRSTLLSHPLALSGLRMPSVAAFAIVRICAQPLLHVVKGARSFAAVPWWLPLLALGALFLLGITRRDGAHLRGDEWVLSREVLFLASGAAAALLVTLVELGWNTCTRPSSALPAVAESNTTTSNTAVAEDLLARLPTTIPAREGEGADRRVVWFRQASPVDPGSRPTMTHLAAASAKDAIPTSAPCNEMGRPVPSSGLSPEVHSRSTAECTVDCIVWALFAPPIALVVQMFVGIALGTVVPGMVTWSAQLSMNVSIVVYFLFISTKASVATGGHGGDWSGTARPNVPHDTMAMIVATVCMLGATVLSRSVHAIQRTRADQIGNARV